MLEKEVTIKANTCKIQSNVNKIAIIASYGNLLFNTCRQLWLKPTLSTCELESENEIVSRWIMMKFRSTIN